MSFQAAMQALTAIDVPVAAALITLMLSFTLSVTGLTRIAVHTLGLRRELHQHSEDRHAH